MPKICVILISGIRGDAFFLVDRKDDCVFTCIVQGVKFTVTQRSILICSTENYLIDFSKVLTPKQLNPNLPLIRVSHDQA